MAAQAVGCILRYGAWDCPDNDRVGSSLWALLGLAGTCLVSCVVGIFLALSRELHQGATACLGARKGVMRQEERHQQPQGMGGMCMAGSAMSARCVLNGAP